MAGLKKRVPTASVIGIGRVGLPFSLILADSGIKVFGIGRNYEKIEKINKGLMPFLEKGAPSLLKKHVGKFFFASTDYSNISKSDFIVLTLGTPVDENMNPVLDQIDNALESSKKYFKPGQTLILRSTISPQTTSYVASFINKLPGLKVEENFFLAFCPERIAEGKAIEETKQIPQIIGGVGKKSTYKASEFFKKIGVPVILSNDVSAELAKLFTNMYRYINFAIANEFMLLAKNYDRDIYEIINLVNYKYKRGGLSIPGLSGGPCLFKDGFFLIQDLPFADLVSTSWKINESMPIFLTKQIKEQTKLEGKKVVILGLAFKAESDDIRESLSFKVRKAFLRERANVFLHDPYVKEYNNIPIEKNLKKILKDADVIFIAANHNIYKKLSLAIIKKYVKKNCIVSDVWNVLGTGKIVYKINNIEDTRFKKINLSKI